jgi:hypothetical protein
MRTFYLLLILTSSTVWADALFLKDGKVVSGTYLGGTSRQVRMENAGQIESYDVSAVDRIEFQGPAAAVPAAPPASQWRDQQDANKERPRLMRPDASIPEKPPVASTSTTIPTGTVFNVRMIDAVDSESSQLGQTFQASLDEPIMLDGVTVIPRGADIVAKLVEDKQSGKVTGRTELTMDLVSIRVNGRMIDLNTEEVTTSSESRTGKSAKVIGGTAAVGAILGGIFGGGKGAAIGATSGAGAGTAVQVMTKGQRVKIPAETRLSFTLQNPLKI